MVLSKRWQFLWMFVPKLVYDDNYKNINYARFLRFVDRYLVMHEAPGIETMDFKLGKTCGPQDIKVWIKAADKRCVRELIISGHSIASPAILPRSWYTGCKMVVRLELNNAVLVGFNSSSVSFPSLRNLSLKDVVYPNDGFLNRFLSSCHVLEYLNVEQRPDDNVTVFTIRVPSLKNLLLSKSGERDREDEDGFVIDASSLDCIDIFDYTERFCVIKNNNMPNVVKARFGLSYLHPVNILGYITSVERLEIITNFWK